MIYTKDGRTQVIQERERVRQRILERSGWKRVEAPNDLPADFPGYKALQAAGLTTIDAVRDADLEEVDGIGAATLEKINARLSDG